MEDGIRHHSGTPPSLQRESRFSKESKVAAHILTFASHRRTPTLAPTRALSNTYGICTHTGSASHFDTLIHFTLGHLVTTCFGVCVCVFASEQCHGNLGDPRPSWQGGNMAPGTRTCSTLCHLCVCMHVRVWMECRAEIFTVTPRSGNAHPPSHL